MKPSPAYEISLLALPRCIHTDRNTASQENEKTGGKVGFQNEES